MHDLVYLCLSLSETKIQPALASCIQRRDNKGVWALGLQGECCVMAHAGSPEPPQSPRLMRPRILDWTLRPRCALELQSLGARPSISGRLLEQQAMKAMKATRLAPDTVL